MQRSLPMGERTAYMNGTFSWVENATTDQEGAKDFYSSVFGWDYDDSPVGNGINYSMAKLRDQYVAAIAPQQQDERAMGVPPHWNSYITVDDVDSVSARVQQLDGTLHAGPFDVMDVGRMSALSDPTGAVAYLWQAGRHIGAGLVNEPGTFCWNELGTRDPAVSAQFWSDLMGWEFERIEAAPIDIWTIRNGGQANGSMRRMGDETPSDVPPHWLVYFAVESIEAAGETITGAGGRLIVPKMAAGPGNSFAVYGDSAGTTFGLFEGTLDD